MAERIIKYIRKLSGDEANQHYVMILDESLKLFPNPGNKFNLKVGDLTKEVQVSAVDCWCRGPKKPHVHYRIDMKPFLSVYRPHFGATVNIDKTGSDIFELTY